MKRNFFRLLYLVLVILTGLDFLNVNRALSIAGSLALIAILFLMKEKQSGWSVHQKIMLLFGIVALVLMLGSFVTHKGHLLPLGAVFLVTLFFEWKFCVFSSRWDD